MNKINKFQWIATLLVVLLAIGLVFGMLQARKAQGAILTNIFVNTSAGGTVTNGIITNYVYTPFNGELAIQSILFTNFVTNTVNGLTNGISTNVYAMTAVTPGLFANGNAYTLGGKYTPLSFFGGTPTNQPTVALVTNLASSASNAETTNIVNQLNGIITAMKQLGLSK